MFHVEHQAAVLIRETFLDEADLDEADADQVNSMN